MSSRDGAIANYAVFIGLRYSFSRKRNRFTSVISLVSMLGMVLGVSTAGIARTKPAAVALTLKLGAPRPEAVFILPFPNPGKVAEARRMIPSLSHDRAYEAPVLSPAAAAAEWGIVFANARAAASFLRETAALPRALSRVRRRTVTTRELLRTLVMR